MVLALTLVKMVLYALIQSLFTNLQTVIMTSLKGKFSSGREGALASKFNYDFK